MSKEIITDEVIKQAAEKAGLDQLAEAMPTEFGIFAADIGVQVLEAFKKYFMEQAE